MFYPSGMTASLNGTGTAKNSPSPAPAKPRKPGSREAHVVFQTGEAVELQGPVKHFTRQSAIFELYGEAVSLRTSESLAGFQINAAGRAIYCGSAIISNLVDNSSKLICEVALEKTHWVPDADFLDALRTGSGVREEFDKFEREWQKLYAVSTDFKVAVADMQTYLQDLQLWLNEVEIGFHDLAPREREKAGRDFITQIGERAMRSLAALFEKFEKLASAVEPQSRAAHSQYAQRILHPLVLCSPFMHRTFKKPLGYAGDYEMVRMMTLDPFQGSSLFAKFMNTFFLLTPPVVAHRNRIDTLVRNLEAETLRQPNKAPRFKIFNLGCGPAAEIQRFLADSKRSDQVDFTLLDFNDETAAFARRTLTQIKERHGRATGIEVLKKSVAQLIKSTKPFEPGSYDVVYCAGLFDYLTDYVSTALLEIFYELVAPGGLVLVSNVEASNPSRGWMECMVDWHLVYRNARQMRELIPAGIPADAVRVYSEISSVNIFAEIRKPGNA
jgi:extracellular factor (EF) 3-hydroxypalmitic acid methyl ester biosynthesis protein